MGFLKTWRRKRVLRSTALEDALWSGVTGKLAFLRGLSANESQRLREMTVLFLAEKEMHGAHGLVLTDALRVSVAVQACTPPEP